MTLNTKTSLGNHQFTGLYTHKHQLPSHSGVYLITTLTRDSLHRIIDIGESHNINVRVSNHDRANQWEKHMTDGIFAWTLAASETERMFIEKGSSPSL